MSTPFIHNLLYCPELYTVFVEFTDGEIKTEVDKHRNALDSARAYLSKNDVLGVAVLENKSGTIKLIGVRRVTGDPKDPDINIFIAHNKPEEDSEWDVEWFGNIQTFSVKTFADVLYEFSDITDPN